MKNPILFACIVALIPFLDAIAQGIIIQPTAYVTLQNAAHIRTTGTAGLIIKSTSSGTGSLVDYNTSSGITINGTTSVERYIANDFKWHFLSSPVSSQAIWPQFVPTPSGSPPGWGVVTYNWDFYYWNPNANITNELYWVNLRKNDAGEYNERTVEAVGSVAGFGASTPPALEAGRGYLTAYNAGWYPSASSPETHLFTGTLNVGSVTKAITKGANPYNLVGNPYPSAIDWKAATGWSRSNLTVSGSGYDYWIWNDATANYGTFNSGGTSGTNGVSQYIASGQAFFVEASTSGNLVIANAVRTQSTQVWLKNEDSETNLVRLKITCDANTYSDEMIVDFNPAYTGGGSAKFWSFYTQSPEIYSVKNGNNYSIDRYSAITEGQVVAISAKTGVDATYTINAANIRDFTLSDKVWLEDLKTGDKINMKQSSSYSFTGAPGDDPNRFKMIFGSPDGLEEQGSNDFTIYTNGNSICIRDDKSNEPYTITVINMLGQVITHRMLSGNNMNRVEMNPVSGVYVVTVVSKGYAASKKVVLR